MNQSQLQKLHDLFVALETRGHFAKESEILTLSTLGKEAVQLIISQSAKIKQLKTTIEASKPKPAPVPSWLADIFGVRK